MIRGIAWIGSSFYFIAPDLGLRKASDLPPGVSGEEWQVRDGGFHCIQKYSVAPAPMPDDLVWFKWESYATWLSGFVMLVLIYYLAADLYLIDPNVTDLPVWGAIAISLGSLGFGCLAYDAICKPRFGQDNTKLVIGFFLILVAMVRGYAQVSSGRAARLHLIAFTAATMLANVFLLIIPNQKIVVADLKAGRTPEPTYRVIAKWRNTHNNYLTLPVLFLTLSDHYPSAFSSEYNGLIAGFVFLMGVAIRNFLNTMHACKGMRWWTWGATATRFLAIVALSLAPMRFRGGDFETEITEPSVAQARFAEAEGFTEVTNIVMCRCSMCHGEYPSWDGIADAPKGVVLDTEFAIATHAREIYLQSGVTHANPPGNLTWMEDGERVLIVS